MALQENPPPQRVMARRVHVAQSTVNRHLRNKLKLRMVFKSRGHVLTAAHRRDRKTRCRRLYERHLSGDKWKFVATHDEAWIYLADCGKIRAVTYTPSDAKTRPDFIRQCKASFSKGFMVVAGYCYEGKLTIRRVPNNCKINSAFYQQHILTPIYTEDLPRLYGNAVNQVRVHMDKASSHTSRSTQRFLQQMATDTGIQAIPFQDIPVKSPDASPMDFCGFGLLKRALASRRVTTVRGLWKACQEEWLKIPLPVLQRSLLQWKLRCRAIARRHGAHIEGNRWWSRGFS